MRTRIANFDGSATPRGASCGSPSLQTLVELMLSSTQPIFIPWGSERIPVPGSKHPEALSRPALAVRAEARKSLTPLFDRVFTGEALHLRDIELLLDRHESLEGAHFAFSCHPGARRPGHCQRTAVVLAERLQAAATERQRKLLKQGPGFIAILRGPQRVFEFVNTAYVLLAGGRELIGRQVADAARQFRPMLKVLCIAGYAENAAVADGHLDAGMRILTMPFAMTSLETKVRDIIGR